jgi:hypothetical protein
MSPDIFYLTLSMILGVSPKRTLQNNKYFLDHTDDKSLPSSDSDSMRIFDLTDEVLLPAV